MADNDSPRYVSRARVPTGLTVAPAAVYVDQSGELIPTNKIPAGNLTAVGARKLYIPMIFNLRIPGEEAFNPLVLYVTPAEIQVTRKKALAEHVTRQGTIREEWGDELDIWTCSGQIAAFYSPSFGITQVNRSQTASYKNFLSLLTFFKNNGRSYYTRGKKADGTVEGERKITSRENAFSTRRDRAYANREDFSERTPNLGRLLKDTSTLSRTKKRSIQYEPSRIIRHVGGVEILYDLRILEGHFDSFEWEDSVEHPHNINYSFTFTVKSQFDYAAQMSGYGVVRG